MNITVLFACISLLSTVCYYPSQKDSQSDLVFGNTSDRCHRSLWIVLPIDGRCWPFMWYCQLHISSTRGRSQCDARIVTVLRPRLVLIDDSLLTNHVL